MTDDTPKFESVLKEIMLKEEQGERPNLDQYAESFPELAERLKKFFRDRDWFAAEAERLAPTPNRADKTPNGSSATDAVPSLPPGCRFAGHEIIELVGRGGMGDVYKARQQDPDRLVALKVIRADRLAALSEEECQRWIKRFRREARRIASLDQPSQIVTVYQIGEWRPRTASAKVPFFTMRFIEGGSLAQAASKRREKAGSQKNQTWAAEMVTAAARAVHRAHQKGIFHLDLKPANILLDAEGQPLVSDFGLARGVDDKDSLIETGIAGTVAYMAPEQTTQRAVSPATDVYGLGAILYELLTGQAPYHGKSDFETLLLVAREPPIAPRSLKPGLSRDLETICLKCLEKSPARRYSSAAELADDLEKWQAGRPIKARPVGNLGRLWRWCCRNPALAAVSSAAMVVVVLSVAIYGAYRSVSGDVEVVKNENVRLSTENEKQERTIAANEIKNTTANVPNLIAGGQINKAKEELEKWKPFLKDDNRPPWEVSFLKAQLQDKAFMVHEHRGEVIAVALNPAGTQIASADQDGNIFLWNLADNKRIRDLHIKKGSVFALAWSPDGKRLAVAGGEPAIELALPLPVNPVPQGGLPPPPNSKLPKGKVPNSKPPIGKPDVKPGGDALVQIRDLETNQESILSLKSKIAFQPGIANLVWSPNGETLPIAGLDGSVLVAKPGSTSENLALRGHGAAVHSLSWSPDGNRLASASGDGSMKVWDVAKGKEAYTRPLPGNPLMLGPVPSLVTTWAIAWTADGKLVRAVGPNGQLNSWDAATGQENSSRQLAPRDFGWLPGQRSRFVWHHDGKFLASAVLGQIRIWDGATGQEIHACPSPTEQSFMSMVQCAPAWDQKGRWVALGRSNGAVHAWPVGLKRPSVRNPVPNAQGWSHNSLGLLCKPWAPLNTVPGLVETPEMKEALAALKRAAQAGRITPADPKAIIGPRGENKQAPPGPEPQVQFQICDAVTGEVLRAYAKQASPIINVMAESPNGKWIASASNTSLLQLWPMSSGEPAVALEVAHTNSGPRSIGPSQQTLIAWSPDSSEIAFWTPNQDTIRIWDPVSHKQVQTLDEKDNPIRCLAWCPDSQRLASAGEEGLVKIWDVSSGKASSPGFPYFYKKDAPNRSMATNASSMLAWSPDAKYLAVAGEDERIQIRDVDKNENLSPLLGRTGNKGYYDILCAVAWSPNGKRLAASSPDGTFILYDTSTWREVIALHLPAAGPFQPNSHMPGTGGKLAWSPNGWQLAFFSGSGGSVTIWDATPEEEEPKRQEGDPKK